MLLLGEHVLSLPTGDSVVLYKLVLLTGLKGLL